MPDAWVLWSPELSPFALKVEACLRAHRVPYRWLPVTATRREAWKHALRREQVVRGRAALAAPRMTPLDEFPQVPFLFGPGGENLYDSSAIAVWLDDHLRPAGGGRLLPEGDAALRMAVRLVDEAADEIGLYLVHHGRWVRAARDNDAGRRLAREMRPLLGPLAGLLERRFPARQVRRLPYLFSVADPEDGQWRDLPVALRPPARPGFPPTHGLLEEATDELLAALEPLWGRGGGVFGDAFTLADASLYGQLDMNRSDPSAWQRIVRDAPRTAAWIDAVADGGPSRVVATGATATLDTSCRPLLDWCARWFLPIMRCNAAAWHEARRKGVHRFNEAAFDRGEALYDGEVAGHSYRSVVKTFQVKVWHELGRDFAALDDADRGRFLAACSHPEEMAEALQEADRLGPAARGES